MFGGLLNNTFYEEQRFGINLSEKPSIVRKNFRTIKRITMGARPLESVLKYEKLSIGKTRNAEDEFNRTYDNSARNDLFEDDIGMFVFVFPIQKGD